MATIFDLALIWNLLKKGSNQKFQIVHFGILGNVCLAMDPRNKRKLHFKKAGASREYPFENVNTKTFPSPGTSKG